MAKMDLEMELNQEERYVSSSKETIKNPVVLKSYVSAFGKILFSFVLNTWVNVIYFHFSWKM